MEFLKLENISKTYPVTETKALDHIDLTVDKGEFVSIVGLSGSGKSTLIRIINRLIDPTSGSVHYNGENVLGLENDELKKYRQKIGMIFQHYNLIERFEVLRNVLSGKYGNYKLFNILVNRYPEADVKKAGLLIKKVGLEDFVTQRVDKLSGGQQQRVGIARALMQNPEMILGDEPVSTLDPVSSEKILNLLTRLNKEENLTVVLNLHNIIYAKKFSKRIIGLRKGRIVFDGKPADLDNKQIEFIYRSLNQDELNEK